MPLFKTLDVTANIRDLQTRRGRPSIAERRLIKRVRRLAAMSLPTTLAGEAGRNAKRTLKPRKSGSIVRPDIMKGLTPELQTVLDAKGPLGMKVDHLKSQRYDVFDDKLPLLRLLDDHFPERSNYSERSFDMGRNISGLLRTLQEHCRTVRNPALMALRVSTVVNVILEETTIEIQNYRQENAQYPEYMLSEGQLQEYKLRRLQDQLQLFVDGLGQTEQAALARRIARSRNLELAVELAFAGTMDSPPDTLT